MKEYIPPKRDSRLRLDSLEHNNKYLVALIRTLDLYRTCYAVLDQQPKCSIHLSYLAHLVSEKLGIMRLQSILGFRTT